MPRPKLVGQLRLRLGLRLASPREFKDPTARRLRRRRGFINLFAQLGPLFGSLVDSCIFFCFLGRRQHPRLRDNNDLRWKCRRPPSQPPLFQRQRITLLVVAGALFAGVAGVGDLIAAPSAFCLVKKKISKKKKRISPRREAGFGFAFQ